MRNINKNSILIFLMRTFSEFLCLAEGKKKKLEKMLKHAYEQGTKDIGVHVQVVKKPKHYDSIEDMKKSHGGRAVKKAADPERKIRAYNNRRDERVKELVKATLKNHFSPLDETTWKEDYREYERNAAEAAARQAAVKKARLEAWKKSREAAAKRRAKEEKERGYTVDRRPPKMKVREYPSKYPRTFRF